MIKDQLTDVGWETFQREVAFTIAKQIIKCEIRANGQRLSEYPPAKIAKLAMERVDNDATLRLRVLVCIEGL